MTGITRPQWMPQRPAVDALPPGSPSGKAAANILVAELLGELRAMKRTTTESMGRLAGLIVNDVLQVGSWKLDASGYYQLSWHVAAGCIVVDNQSTANVMWVVPGAWSGNIPQAGPTVTPVPFGKQRTVNLAARECTIIGTSGDTVAFQAFTKGAAPGTSLGFGGGA